MNTRSKLNTPQIQRVNSLDESAQREMFALFEHYYADTQFARFAADLAEKDFVLLLRDEAGGLQGFSTLAVYARTFAGRRVRVLFSGDTVVDENHWGQQALAFAWLRLAGDLKAEHPDQALYWLLISKGHRTYRYLSAFSREYFPAPDQITPQPMAELMEFLARDRFGAAYDTAAGVLRFPQSQGHLRDTFAQIPDAHLRLPAVEFFLARNPGYVHGDELVCLCELSADNLQPIARRAFLSGVLASPTL